MFQGSLQESCQYLAIFEIDENVVLLVEFVVTVVEVVSF